jgi:hypothetical protein
VGGTLPFVAVGLVLMPLTMFVVPELVVSDAPPLELIRRAWRIGSGMRLRMFGYGFVAGLVIVAGAILCILPVLPALGLAHCLLLALFLAARNGLGLPPADHR